MHSTTLHGVAIFSYPTPIPAKIWGVPTYMIIIPQRYRQTDRQLALAIPRYTQVRVVKKFMKNQSHSGIVNQLSPVNKCNSRCCWLYIQPSILSTRYCITGSNYQMNLSHLLLILSCVSDRSKHLFLILICINDIYLFICIFTVIYLLHRSFVLTLCWLYYIIYSTYC